MASTTKKKKYLYEVDLMRVIFIFGVLANHATSVIISQMVKGSGPWYALLSTHLLLHFTRMGFMFITGLVLFLNYYKKPSINYWSFWLKRYKGSGIPYLFWNAFLLLITAIATSSLGTFGSQWLGAILHGDHFYMYYILVVFQLYLIFPLLIMLFKKTVTLRNHLIVLGISFVLQLAFLFFTKYAYPYISHAGWPYMFVHYGNFVLSYQFYFIAGAFVSAHYETTISFLKKYQRIIFSITGLLALGTFGLFYYNWHILKLSEHLTELVHQPYLLFYASFMVISVFLISLKYAERRSQPNWQPFAKFVAMSSKISFGIYLSQSLSLMILTAILSLFTFPNWALILILPFAYIFALGGAWLTSYFCMQIPPFGILVGRPNHQKLKHHRSIISSNNNFESTKIQE